ncbi:hypothetical protein PI124_g23342 [Phytophthora idaei]|nr:hypothetical protein PI126_g22272 [Phytophthora idaei]KAG3231561.1 hypothetical protein PI124_g23342 [Phytophthora idaei]
MHANDGSVAENWIIERGGWQLGQVNKAFGYMLGSTQADQQVSRVLSGWKSKDGARLPSLAALGAPISWRAHKLQEILFSNTLAFDNDTLNIDEGVADVLTATLLMHYSDMLRLCEGGQLILKMREAIAGRSISEAEVLAWSSSIRRVFMPPQELKPLASPARGDPGQIAVLLEHVQRQTEKIEVLILQNKQLEERLLAVEHRMHVPGTTMTQDPPSGVASASSAVSHSTGHATPKVARAKKKGSQSLAAIWFEWFTAEPRVYASPAVKKTTLYEFRHITGYMMLFLPTGLALDASSPALKDEVLALDKKARENAIGFLKAHGSSAVAGGTALKALRQLHKQGKLDEQIAQFHELVDNGVVVDPTLRPFTQPSSAFDHPNSLHISHNGT